MPAMSIVSPLNSSFSWDRNGTPPEIGYLLLTIAEAEAILYVRFSIQYENTSVQWLETPEQGSSYIDHTGNSGQLLLAFKNLNQLPVGSYKATVYFELSTADYVVRNVSSRINLTLSGSPVDAVTQDKSIYNLLYRRSTNTISGDTTVNILNNSELAPIEFETIGPLLLDKTATSSFTLEDNPAHPLASAPELPLNGIYEISARLKKAGIYISNFIVRVLVLDQLDIISAPERLDFSLRKGFNETQTESLQIFNPLNKTYTVTKPSWLNLGSYSGNTTETIFVSTVNSDTLPEGAISDFITITYETKTIQVPVSLSVTSFYKLPLQEYNFCLDNIVLQLEKMFQLAELVRIKLKIKLGPEEINTEFTFPYYKNKASFNIGEKVQRYFSDIFEKLEFSETIDFNNFKQYQAAKVSLEVSELKADYSVLFTASVPEFELFAGSKPKLFPLFTNTSVRRYFQDSPFLFSYETDEVIPEDLVLHVDQANTEGSKEVHSVMIPLENVNLSVLKTKFGLEYLQVPHISEFSFVQFFTENKAVEYFPFTGKFLYQNEFEHITQSIHKGGKKFDTKVVGKITMNTGFIFKEEIDLLFELIQSNYCFIVRNGKTWKAFPTQPKLVREDSLTSMFDYELEFFHIL